MENQKNNKFQVKLSDYTCPLDVLLDMISKKKIDLSEISVSSLVDQYIEFKNNMINDLKLEEFGNYLSMNAYLIMLKTKFILNQDSEVKLIDTEEGQDLILRLIERSKYANSISFFQNMFERRKTLLDKDSEDYDEYSLGYVPVADLPNRINVQKLQKLYQNIIDQLINDAEDDASFLFKQDITFCEYSIHDIQKQIIKYLIQQPNKQDSFYNCFKNNLDKIFNRVYFSSFFLAILTLIKNSYIYLIDTSTENVQDDYLVQLSTDVKDVNNFNTSEE